MNDLETLAARRNPRAAWPAAAARRPFKARLRDIGRTEENLHDPAAMPEALSSAEGPYASLLQELAKAPLGQVKEDKMLHHLFISCLPTPTATPCRRYLCDAAAEPENAVVLREKIALLRKDFPSLAGQGSAWLERLEGITHLNLEPPLDAKSRQQRLAAAASAAVSRHQKTSFGRMSSETSGKFTVFAIVVIIFMVIKVALLAGSSGSQSSAIPSYSSRPSSNSGGSQQQMIPANPYQPSIPGGNPYQPSIPGGNPYQPSIPGGNPYQPSIPGRNPYQPSIPGGNRHASPYQPSLPRSSPGGASPGYGGGFR
ncbi:MAG: hypothetical protein RL095_1814 [Verrucomicrobiota bacterium]|jgi:hypothetical protein